MISKDLNAKLLIVSEVVGLKDRKEVENLQDQSLNMLQHQVTSVTSGVSGAPPAPGHLSLVHTTRLNTRYARSTQS